MDLGLESASVLVTGGSRGIGMALAIAFAREKANVAFCGRNRTALEAVADRIRSAGGRCLPVVADLTVPEDCERFVNEAAAAFGRVDVLINNASANVDGTPKAIELTSDAEIAARFNGKTMPAIRCSRAAVPHMRRSGGGRIVMIGGTAALSVMRGLDNPVPSGGSGMAAGLGNSALANFTKHLAEEVARQGISVNVVHPYATRTDRYPARITKRALELNMSEAEAEASLVATMPIGRLVEPDDIVPLVMFLASPLAGAITGQSVAVDGGALRQVSY